MNETKASIQREMIRKSGENVGYLIWLDYRRQETWEGLARPNILPHVPSGNERPNEESKKLYESAKAIGTY